MKQPTLSVLMSNYNHSLFLPESLQAIVDQNYQPKEFIVIDDASTDNSLEVIDEYARRFPLIHVVRNKRNMGGLYNANRLLELASGEFVFYGAADDKVLPGLFDRSMTLLGNFPDAGLCSTLMLAIDINGHNNGVCRTPLISTRPCYLSPTKIQQLLNNSDSSWINSESTIYRRDALINVGGFVPELASYSDRFTQNVLALRHGACFIPEVLACRRFTEGSYSTLNASNLDKWKEIMTVAEKLMQTKYLDISMPNCKGEEYLGLWSIGKSEWQKVRHQQDQYIFQTLDSLIPTQSSTDYLFKAMVQLLTKTQSLVVKVYLMFKFRSVYQWLLLRLKFWLYQSKYKVNI